MLSLFASSIPALVTVRFAPAAASVVRAKPVMQLAPYQYNDGLTRSSALTRGGDYYDDSDYYRDSQRSRLYDNNYRNEGGYGYNGPYSSGVWDSARGRAVDRHLRRDDYNNGPYMRNDGFYRNGNYVDNYSGNYGYNGPYSGGYGGNYGLSPYSGNSRRGGYDYDNWRYSGRYTGDNYYGRDSYRYGQGSAADRALGRGRPWGSYDGPYQASCYDDRRW